MNGVQASWHDYEGTPLYDAVSAARDAAGGDSNDEEIEALTDALTEALSLLGLNYYDMEED